MVYTYKSYTHERTKTNTRTKAEPNRRTETQDPPTGIPEVHEGRESEDRPEPITFHDLYYDIPVSTPQE